MDDNVKMYTNRTITVYRLPTFFLFGYLQCLYLIEKYNTIIIINTTNYIVTKCLGMTISKKNTIIQCNSFNQGKCKT